MEPAPFTIRYRFTFQDAKRTEFLVHLHPRTLLNLAPLPEDLPAWTRLECEKCPTCPLEPELTPHCPTAAHLVPVVADFSQTVSFTNALVCVETPERTSAKDTTVQTGLSSLLGIYMSTSGCPVLATLRPMVRLHLPFASQVETIFRSTSTYLLGQFFRARSGRKPDWELAGLAQIYRETAEVNRAFAKRLRHAAALDANINALVLLDVFAKVLPGSIEDGLKDIRELFDAWEQGSE